MFALAFLAGGDEGGKMFIQRSYPKDASQVLDRYSADNYGSFREAFSAYFADSTFHYPTHAFIQHAIGKGIKVYKYRFEVALKSSEKFAMGAHHAGE